MGGAAGSDGQELAGWKYGIHIQGQALQQGRPATKKGVDMAVSHAID